MSEQGWVRLQSYSFRTIWGAHLARSHLAQEGIQAEIRHEQLAQLTGANPFFETEIELWVKQDDLERARQVLAAQDVGDPQPERIVVCPACGASSPSDFSRCWKCDGDVSGVESQRAPLDGPDEGRVVVRERLPGAARAVMLLLFAAVVMLGFILHSTTRKLRTFQRPSPLFESAWNQQAQCMETRWRDGETIYFRKCDPKDGVFRRSGFFYRDGTKWMEYADLNANGIEERKEVYDRSGKLARVYLDQDETGCWEEIQVFASDGRLTRRDLDADENGRVERSIEYHANGAQVIRFDADGDGLYERRVVRDASGAKVLEETHGRSE
jgi:hypothetical protein